MIKSIREAIDMVRAAGGTNISVVRASRHTRVAFMIDGRRDFMTVHAGSHLGKRMAPLMRSRLRRKMQ